MSFTRKYLPPALAIVVGIANGVYIFKPSIVEERQGTLEESLTPQSQPPQESKPSEAQPQAEEPKQ